MVEGGDDREFEAENRADIANMSKDEELNKAALDLMIKAQVHKYSYHFRWMGRPIIQYPQDIVAMQEVIWEVQPELIVETGVARGGSTVFHASLLKLLGGERKIIGIDIDIRAHNRKALDDHPMRPWIELIEASSIDPVTVAQVKKLCEGKNVLVILDSNHTHEHVLAELKAYAPLVNKGSYLIVMDTVVEDLLKGSFPDRPWDIGDNPKTAVMEFLKTTDRFEIDGAQDAKLLLTVAPSGYLRCIKDDVS
ncbi:MAG: cephalosporin hydroxylase [bacterium]|nr:cephalosporin hydroxylase [bacterium]